MELKIDCTKHTITLPNGAFISTKVCEDEFSANIIIEACDLDSNYRELACVDYSKANKTLCVQTSDQWDDFTCLHNDISKALTYEEARDLCNKSAGLSGDDLDRVNRAFARELLRRDEAAKPGRWLKWFSSSADSSNTVKAECSSCGKRFDASVYGAAFCPNCGRPMEVKS